MQPRAIETRYKGYRFRSRLEARWAVFFDALGLKWEYEPEGFDLGDGVRYLPDFKATSPTGLVAWYEIKPTTVKSDPKFDLFTKLISPSGGYLDSVAELLSGDPFDVIGSGANVCPRCGLISKAIEVYDDSNDIGVICWRCDYDTPSGGGNPVERGILSNVKPHKGSLLVTYPDWRKVKQAVTSAAVAARGARFEHGEVPRV